MKRSVLVFGAMILILAAVGCQKQEGAAVSEQEQEEEGGLQIVDLQVGDGEEVATGDFVLVHYTGWLWENDQKEQKFDSSYDRNQPFSLKVGRGMVIKGWDQGIPGMKVGGKRTLLIPPELGYGSSGNARIPANSTLYFEVELVGKPTVQKEDLVIGEGALAEEGDNVAVHYTGWLFEDGERTKQFDSSHDRGDPFSFQLGAGRVIPGWDLGVPGLRVGGKRLLTIPSELAYGERGARHGGEIVIPPNTMLQFEVELLEVVGKQ